jgi:DNA-binding transcriptional ArsR family regulator
MSECETRTVNVSTMFFDPEGDPLTYTLVSLELGTEGTQPDVALSGDRLTISSSVSGSGGEVTVLIEAEDAVSDLSSGSRMIVHIKDVDGPCVIGSNPGPVVLYEDQDQVVIPIEGWFVDNDTELSDYTFGTYPSSRLLETSIDFAGGSPYLLVRPTGNLNGDHYVWVDAANGVGSVYDRMDVLILPVNDPPTIRIEWSEPSSGSWTLRGEVQDPDSASGRVQFRIGDGEWRTAEGWNSFTMTIPYEDLDVSGSFVFFRADDLIDFSVEEHIRLTIPLPWGLQYVDSDGDGVTDLFDEFPQDPTEVYDTDEDGYGDNSDAFPTNPFEHLDTDGDGYGDNSDAFPEDPTRYTEEVAPDLPGSHRTGRGWLFAIGGFAIVGLIIFFLFTEIGMVAVATAAASIYSKLSTKDVLNHEIRGLIRGYIIANPGDHYSSIKRNLDLNNGTLAYHLRVLEQNGLIKSLYDGVFKRYYPANVNISKVKKNVSKQEEIFNIILENPGISMEQIGRLIGVSRQVVNYHVKNLIRSGLISYQRDMKSAKFFPNGNGGNGHEGEI